MFLEEWLQQSGTSPAPASRLQRMSSMRRHLLNCKVEYTVMASMTLAAFAIGFLMGYDQSVVLTTSTALQQQQQQEEEPLKVEKAKSTKSPLELLGEFSKAKFKLRTKLRDSYQHYYSILFDNVLSSQQQQEQMFFINQESQERLTRRLMIKLLEANIHNNNNEESSSASSATTFTWVTAGDSAAAGYGNLFNQSYTAVLTDALQDVFRSVGITFVAKNYARANFHASVAELSLCQEAVYGSNIDILNFDYAMTHRSMPHLSSLWANRAAATYTSSKPILFMMDNMIYSAENDNNNNNANWDAFASLEGKGISSIFMDQSKLTQLVLQRIPSSSGLDSNGNLPPSLQYLSCATPTISSIEGSFDCMDKSQHYKCLVDDESSRVCNENKYDTKGACGGKEGDNVWYQSSWHPGWKVHQLKGHLLSIFLINALQTALLNLDNLMSNPPPFTYDEIINENIPTETDDDLSNPTRLLIYLLNKEELDHFLFQTSPPSDTSSATDVWKTRYGELLHMVGHDILYQRQSMCRTALLPSDARYSNNNGITPAGSDGTVRGAATSPRTPSYDVGVDMNTIPSPPLNNILPLAFDPLERQACSIGSESETELFNIDCKDFFHVRQGDDWVTTTIPSKTEMERYEKISRESNYNDNEEGQRKDYSNGGKMIIICFRTCFGEGCPPSDADAMFLEGLDGVKLSQGNIEFEVDGRKVIGLKEIEGCHFLVGEGHSLVWSRLLKEERRGENEGWNDEGLQYDVRIRVNEPGGVMKITSIILL